MPLQNRVTPEGDIVAVSDRGTMYGNRGGCFHTPDRHLKKRRYANRQWICCVLQFKGRRRTLMQPDRFTELFFLDEATAMAAGHRPCFECRRADATRFAELWNRAEGHSGRAAAPAMDLRLHPERIDASGAKITFGAKVSTLPDGTFIRRDGKSALKWGSHSFAWSFAGYAPPRPLAPTGTCEVLTPRSIVAVLSAGYAPGVHASAALSANKVSP